MLDDNLKTGLGENHLNTLEKFFLENNKIDTVIIFGSRARGDFNDRSDIDLAIKFNSGENYEKVNILQNLRDLNIIYKIDVVDMENISDENFKENIIRDGKEFYKSKIK